MRTYMALLFMLVLAGSAQSTWVKWRSPAPIIHVSVRDADFKVVKVLAPSEVAAFHLQWKNKQAVDSSLLNTGGAHFKLDIEWKAGSGRWLYLTTGYVQLLSKKVTPVYKMEDPEAFNRLIGAAK